MTKTTRQPLTFTTKGRPGHAFFLSVKRAGTQFLIKIGSQAFGDIHGTTSLSDEEAMELCAFLARKRKT